MEKIIKFIPKKLLKENKVDISLFRIELENGQRFKGPEDYSIKKDCDHGGRVWKLINSRGKQICSLGADGTILTILLK